MSKVRYGFGGQEVRWAKERKTKHFICFFQPHVCLQVMLKIDEWEAETK